MIEPTARRKFKVHILFGSRSIIYLTVKNILQVSLGIAGEAVSTSNNYYKWTDPIVENYALPVTLEQDY